MIIGIGIPFGRRGGGFTAEYKAILARATALGYTLPSEGQQVKQNNLLKALIAAGIWAKLDVFYVYANDAGADFATLNWKAPTLYQSTRVNSPTFTANEGFAGNGITSYLNSNFNLFLNSVNYTQDNSSIGVYKKSGTSTGDKCLIGVLQTGPTIGSHMNAASTVRQNSATGAASLNWTNGLCSLVRNNSSNYNTYNGNSKTPNSYGVTSTGVPNANVFVLARSVNNSISNPTDEQVSVSYIGGNITAEYSAFVDILQNYITAI
jgi:hypothetical protein